MDAETKLDQILKIVTMTQQNLMELKRDFKDLKEDVAELKERIAKLEERVAKLEERVAKLEERVTKLEERMTSLERSVLLIETEHGEKINALFDAMKTNEDAHKRIEKAIENLKSEIQGTLFNHEKRISKLEGNLVPSF